MCNRRHGFSSQNIHKLTWKSSECSTANHFFDVRAFMGEDVSSDYYLVRAVIQFKLRKAPKQESVRKKLHIPRLNIPTVRRAFSRQPFTYVLCYPRLRLHAQILCSWH
jgi:hypothetical protein